MEYISVWDGDEIVTHAKVNSKTGEIIEIKTCDISNKYNSCEREFVRYADGTEVDVIKNNGRYYVSDKF